MKNKVFTVLALALFAWLGSTPAFAQDHSRGWDEGYIVQVTEVHTKDGMFNAYINDRGVEYFENLSSEIMGSLEDMREANIDRGELRTIGSTYTLRELTFKD